MNLDRGAVVLVDLNPTAGNEQHGVRPCIVVSDPDVIDSQRFPLVCVVPITGTPGEGLLYPPLAAGRSGLAKKSYALVDHLRSIDKRRVRRLFGQLGGEELVALDDGIASFLGLRGPRPLDSDPYKTAEAKQTLAELDSWTKSNPPKKTDIDALRAKLGKKTSR